MNYSPKEKKLVKDGRPAVCATPFTKIAIFRALVYKDWNSFGQRNGKIFMCASPEAIKIAKSLKKNSYVYIFYKKDFRQYSLFELRRYQPIAPIGTIRIAIGDLPSGIRIIKSWQRLRKQYI